MDSIKSVLNENVTISTVSLLIALVVIIYFYYQNQYKYFERLGLKSPPAYPPLGNLWRILMQDRMVIEREWARNFGKIYGIYEGVRKRFVIADAEILRQICIKDFDVFPNHHANQFVNDYARHFILLMQDDQWKRVRAIQSPTFTSGKIKRMFKLIDCCADDLVKCFDEQHFKLTKPKSEGATVNIKDIYSLFTMDAIASCGYGLKLERAGSSSIESAANRNEFVRLAMRLFEFNIPRFIIIFSLPQWFLKPFKFRMTPESKVEPLAVRVRQIVEKRKKSGKKHDDYLQILLDARLDDEMELNELDAKENHHAGLTHESLMEDQKRMINQTSINGNELTKTNGHTDLTTNKAVKALSDEEILCSAIFLLMVGLETTATLLTHCTYALAFHPEIQEKLYEEIKSMAEFSDENKSRYVFGYDILTSNQYLDAVISETLRNLSPVLALDRVSNADYYIEKYNVTIPKESKLNLAYHAIMNDPDYWPEPERFDPERFMPGQREKIVPGSYCPFGIGPRHCLGMRFSLTETKLALAKVMMQYKFLPAPGTAFPPTAMRGFGLNRIKNPLVHIEPRS